MIIENMSVREGRNYLNDKRFSHFVWNYYNPINLLRKGHIVHHKDQDTLNDHISNLELLTRAEHASLHHKGKIVSPATKRKLSEFNKGRVFSDEHKRNLSEAWKGRIVSEETKRKMSDYHKGKSSGMKGKHLSEEARKKISDSLKGKKRPPFSDEWKRKISEARKRRASL